MDMSGSSDESSSEEEAEDGAEAVRPSDLKEKYAAKLLEIRNNSQRDLPLIPRTEEEQKIVR
jgi:hypothetical protein